MKKLAIGFTLIAATTGCLKLLEPSDLQGTWVATSIILSEADNPSNSVDILVESDVVELVIAFELNIYQSRVVDVEGVEEFFEDEYFLDGGFMEEARTACVKARDRLGSLERTPHIDGLVAQLAQLEERTAVAS